MKKMPPWRTIVSLVTVTVFASGCGQSQMTSSVSDTKANSVEQSSWKQLTDAADAALKQGNKAEAERNYIAAMIEAKRLGAVSPAQEEAITNLANFYYVQGAGEEANQLYRSSLALHEKILGTEHIDLTTDLIGLARVSSSQKKYAQASAFYQRAIAILRKAGCKIPPHLEADYVKVQNLASAKGKQGS